MTLEQKREHERVKALFTELMDKPLQTFPPLRGELKAPDQRGVYVIYLPRGKKVLHVGRTPRAQGGIAQRLRDHMSGNSSFVIQYLDRDGSKLRGKYKFHCIVVDNPERRAFLEAYATGQLCPDHIGLGLGKWMQNNF